MSKNKLNTEGRSVLPGDEINFFINKTPISTTEDVWEVLMYALKMSGMQPRREPTPERRYPWRLFFVDYEGEKSVLLPYHPAVRRITISAHKVQWPSQLGCIITGALHSLGGISYLYDGARTIKFDHPNKGIVMKLGKDPRKARV